MKNKLGTALRTAFAASALVMASGAQALTLPTVSACSFAPATLLCYDPYGTGVTEIYVASRHDDFISYSANALQQLANSFNYSGLSEWSNLPSFGSGQIVKLFAYSEAQNGTFPDATTGTGDNQEPSLDGDQTEKNDNQYLGEWPFNAVVTVGDLQAFLGPNLFTPVFSFDFNNTFKTDLFLNGLLEVRPEDGSLPDTFAFDNIPNSDYDVASLVQAQAVVPVTWFDPSRANTTGCNAFGICTMTVDNNVGGGKPDFFAYAPSFDLSKYDPLDTLYFKLYMRGLDASGEELALVNLIGVPVTEVPEPGVLALMGLALLGLGVTRRVKKQV